MWLNKEEHKANKIKDAVADAIGKRTPIIITVIVIVIIAITVEIIPYAFHISVKQFWIAAGVIYVVLGCFNYGFASRILLIEVPPIGKYRILSGTEETVAEMQEKAERRSAELREQELHEGVDDEEMEEQSRVAGTFLDALALKNQIKAAKSFNKAVQTIENLASGFNKSAEVNRNVLYVAAVSFFVAAGISFAQGLGLL
jgi:hypothetical protein